MEEFSKISCDRGELGREAIPLLVGSVVFIVVTLLWLIGTGEAAWPHWARILSSPLIGYLVGRRVYRYAKGVRAMYVDEVWEGPDSFRVEGDGKSQTIPFEWVSMVTYQISGPAEVRIHLKHASKFGTEFAFLARAGLLWYAGYPAFVSALWQRIKASWMREGACDVERSGELARAVLVQRIFEVVGNAVGVPAGGLSEETDLYKDAGLVGDDVDELFTEFSECLGFPLQQIDVQGCFPGEGSWGFPWALIFGSFRPERRCRVRHLVEAVETGCWPELELTDDTNAPPYRR